ncbi:MAG: pentapeptide repeat-containing protein [Rhizobiaceae bacterium]|nr:pentapeptide repeat-containing protein [Paracoccaceae bacterium]MBL4733604.1 pentapeptide repeat-containing protein [Rhizobiaceae bacterium]
MGTGVVHSLWSNLDWEDYRNITLIGSALVAIFVGMPLLYLRTHAAVTQLKLSEEGQNLDRYQMGSTMLGDDKLSVRTAGIFGLHELVQTSPKQHFRIVWKVLAAFTNGESDIALRNDQDIPERTDIKSAIVSLETLRKQHRELAAEVLVKSDLSFNYIYIPYVDFRDAWLEGFSFKYATINSSKFDRADLNGVEFDAAVMDSSNFAFAKMRMASFVGASLINANFYNGTLAGAQLDLCNLTKAKFSGADLANASMKNTILDEVDLSGAQVHGVNFYGAVMKRTILSNEQLSYAQLSKDQLATVITKGH